MLQARTLTKGEISTLKWFLHSYTSYSAVAFPTEVMIIYWKVNQMINKLITKNNQ